MTHEHSVELSAIHVPAPKKSAPSRTPVYTGPVKASIQWVSPALAELWLIQNTHNRNLSDDVIGRITRDILADDYQLNGETIKRSENGTIIDGQHRLWAIVNAQKGVWSVVVEGLPLTAQETVDRVKTRNIADALRLRGEINSNLLAGAVANAIVLLSPTPTDVSKVWPSVSEAIEYLDKHPEIRNSVPIAEALSRMTKTSSVLGAALHHVFAAIDEDDANDFFDKLTTGAGLAADSPVYKLRDFMLREIGVPRRVARARLLAYWIKAWNYYRQGRAMQVLKWSTGGKNPEPFPKPE